MKIETKDLTGAALDWAVCVAEDDLLAAKCIQYPHLAEHYPKVSPSTNWSQGGPIIEREKISVVCVEGDYNPDKAGTPDCYDIYWVAEIGRVSPQEDYGPQGDFWGASLHIYEDEGVAGPTPLIAAMRCYVASRLGREVDIPDELFCPTEATQGRLNAAPERRRNLRPSGRGGCQVEGRVNAALAQGQGGSDDA
jgi:hypothetical protein